MNVSTQTAPSPQSSEAVVPAQPVGEPQGPSEPASTLTLDQKVDILMRHVKEQDQVIERQNEYINKVDGVLGGIVERMKQGPQAQGGGAFGQLRGLMDTFGINIQGETTASLDPLTQELVDLQKQGYILYQKRLLKKMGLDLGLPEHVVR